MCHNCEMSLFEITRVHCNSLVISHFKVNGFTLKGNNSYFFAAILSWKPIGANSSFLEDLLCPGKQTGSDFLFVFQKLFPFGEILAVYQFTLMANQISATSSMFSCFDILRPLSKSLSLGTKAFALPGFVMQCLAFNKHEELS